MHKRSDPSETIVNFVHDIRGPLCNLSGFSDELELAVKDLIKTIKLHEQQLPIELLEKLTGIVEADITPCLAFSRSSIDKMGSRLDQIETDG
ncbi:MAG: hypothetical protein AB8B79_00965 [Granulosicoccus sp.]